MRRRSSEKTEEVKSEPKKPVEAPVGADRPVSKVVGDGVEVIDPPTVPLKSEAEKPPIYGNLRMPEGFEKIITRQFQVEDEEMMYLDLRASLTFDPTGEKASNLSYGGLLNALDAAEENAHRGAELAARAHLAHQEFELDAQVILSSLHDNAKRALEERKAELKAETKTSGKQITNADVISEIAQLHPDEWAELQTRRKKAELSMKLFDDLHERLVQRAGHLRTMVARSRQVE